MQTDNSTTARALTPNRRARYFTCCKAQSASSCSRFLDNMRLPAVFPTLLIALALPATALVMHPKLVSSSPAANTTVATSPASVTATFNEKITVGLSRLTLWDAASRAVALDSFTTAADDNKTLTAKVPTPLVPGRYTVRWQAAGGDGHPMKGEFTFGVADNKQTEQMSSASPR